MGSCKLGHNLIETRQILPITAGYMEPGRAGMEWYRGMVDFAHNSWYIETVQDQQAIWNSQEWE